MATTVVFSKNIGQIKWSISISHLKLGVYRALLFNASNKVLEKWEDQRTDDSLPDSFEIKTPLTDLSGCTLWWECIVSDPSDNGGPYVCTVTILQNGNVIGQDPTTGEVPAGKGKLDSVGDQVSFT
jgi:hypothetical protein